MIVLGWGGKGILILMAGGRPRTVSAKWGNSRRSSNQSLPSGALGLSVVRREALPAVWSGVGLLVGGVRIGL